MGIACKKANDTKTHYGYSVSGRSVNMAATNGLSDSVSSSEGVFGL